MTDHRYPLESLFGRILSPFEEFLRRTTAGGIVLMVTAAIAVLLATAVGREAVDHFWARSFSVALADRYALKLSLLHWVNDGLMALFFLLVGLELKREILVGELSSAKAALLPVFAAIGGMIVPALIYMSFNLGQPSAVGWGIPVATDIAFAVGILVLLAWRIPRNLIVFLAALAIADDLGAVLVIAIFYTADLDLQALGAASILLVILLLMNRGGIRNPLPYALFGGLLWYALHASGIHATVAGILLAAVIPARPAYTPEQFERRIDELSSAFRADRRDMDTPDDPLSNERMASIAQAAEHSAAAVQSPLQRIEHGLTPWVTFIVIPVFALANAGVDLGRIAVARSMDSSVILGVSFGLVIGKFVGVTSFAWIATRLGLARLPSGVQWRHLLGAAWLTGIGFTMSLFIAQLAFAGNLEMIDEAKVGILLGSAVSAIIGLCWLFRAGSVDRGRPRDLPIPPASAR